MTTAREQAAGAAQAAVPTKQSIMQQYGQSIGDVSGFTKALMGLLQQGPGVAAGYAPAIAQQQGVTNAAQQRIAALTGGAPAQLGSQVAVGGMGDSAVSHLIASQAAARTYGAQLPRAAAARGQLAQQSLITGRNQALQQRSQQYQSAFQQALAQALQNRMAMRQFNASMGFKQQQLALQAQEANAANQYRYAALQQNANQFSRSQALQFQEFQTKLKASLQSGSGGGLAGLTRNEISGLQSRAYSYVNDTATLHGVPIQIAIKNLLAQGIPREIAVYTASEAYGNMSAPQQSVFRGTKSVRQSDGTYKTVKTYNGLGYQQALQAYHSSLGSFRKWVRQRQFKQTLRQQRSQGTAPGQGRGVG